MPAGGSELDAADRQRLKLLKAACLLDGELELLIADLDDNRAAAAAIAAADEKLHLKFAGCLDLEFKAGPIVGIRPVAEGVLVRQRLVAELLAMDTRRAGVNHHAPV